MKEIGQSLKFHRRWQQKRVLSMAQNPDGGGYEIRTREAVTPTRFPSVRHRPLGESSMVFSMQTHLKHKM